MKAAVLRWAQEVRIKSGPKVVLQALVRRMNKGTGLCFPSLKTLAKDTGLAESTIRAALRDLEAHGLITTEHRRKGGRQTSNDYHLHVGAKPKPIGKRSDAVRNAKQRAVQAPVSGGWEEASSHRNTAAVQTPDTGPEYSIIRGREDGADGRFHPGVWLAGDELISSPLDALDDSLDSDPSADAVDLTTPGPTNDLAGADAALLAQEDGFLTPWQDGDAAAREAQALGAACDAGSSPSSDLTEAPDLPQRPEVEVVAFQSGETPSWSKADWQAYFDERAGIAEVEGGLSRPEAEALAYEGCLAECRDQNPVGSPTNPGERTATALAAMGFTNPTDRTGRKPWGEGRSSPGGPHWEDQVRRPGGGRVMPSRAYVGVRRLASQVFYGETEHRTGWLS